MICEAGPGSWWPSVDLEGCKLDMYSCAQLEMILQAQEYEGRQDIRLDEFFASTAGKWRTDLGRQWAAEIVSRRLAPS